MAKTILRTNYLLLVVFLLNASSVVADPFKRTDANPRLDDPVVALKSIASQGREIAFRHGDTVFPNGGHFQGIQSFFDRSRNERICFVSRDSNSKAYFVTVAFGAEFKNVGQIRHLQYLALDGKQPPLRHAGGIQLIGQYLVVGVEDNQDKLRSQVQFWDVADPFAPRIRTPLTIVRESSTPKDKTAGAVGIVKRTSDHLLVVANWDAKALDFYVSNGRSLDDDACRFRFDVRWSVDVANRQRWEPDKMWGKYQGVNLVCDRDFNVFLFGFGTNGRGPATRDIIDLFSVEVSQDSRNMIRKIASKRIKLSGGSHFQYSGGISVESPMTMSCYATERDGDGETKVTVLP